MSLIVLNSKGSDPEDFSNFMTEQIKFPRDAEVCLVSSNINRKMMIALEAEIGAGSNSIGFQLGSGTLLPNSTRDDALYTAHSPQSINVESKGKNFPIKLSTTDIGGMMNETMNNPDNIIISNCCRGWASGFPTIGLLEEFNFWNTPQVPTDLGSDGTLGDWTNILGGTANANGVNSTTALGGEATPGAGGGGYENWTKCEEKTGNNNFADLTPIWNTDTGGRVGLFPATASNTNVSGGGWNWRFATDGADVTQTLALRGGIFDNTSFTTNDITNVNSNTNKLTGGAAYTIWWELTDPTAAPGTQVDFYARQPGSKPDRGIYNKNADDVVRWASATLPPAPGAHYNIGIRPVNDTSLAVPKFALEAYFGVTAIAGNTWTTLPTRATANATLGKIVISDPANVGTYASGNVDFPFDLYRHLPLRMGCNAGEDGYAIYCNAPHHKDTPTEAMSAAAQARFLPYTFLLSDLTPIQQARPEATGGSWDSNCRQILRKSTLARNLGYNTHYGKIAAVAMPPAAAGFPALISIGLTLPEVHSLVVTLPDLPVTGYYGNSSGDAASGTLNMNSGGNSAAIVGVIPVGNRPYKDPTSIPFDDGLAQRGEFFASPMENWISLNNPAPFSLSSIRCRITDELGNKANLLDATSTITIKIKKKSGREAFRQGGMNGVFTEA